MHNKIHKMTLDNQPGHLMSLGDRRKFHVAVFAFKVLNNLTPPYLYDSLKYTHAVTKRTRKNKFQVFLPSVQTNFAKSGFYFQSVCIWNGLDGELCSCTSVKSFKTLYLLNFGSFILY